MKKKILYLIVFLLLFLTSCQVKSLDPKQDPSATYSAFNYSYTDDDYKYAKEVMTEIKDVVDKGKDADRLETLGNWMNEETSRLAYFRQIEDINYYMTGNKDYSDKSEFYHSIILEIDETQLDLYEPCSKNDLRDAFFGELSDEEVQRKVEYAKNEKKKLPLYKKQKELQNEALAINDADQMKPVLIETIQVNKEIAELSGCKDYLEYAFSNVYGRGYTLSDAKDIIRNIKEYVSPCFYDVMDEYINSYHNITNKDESEISKFDSVSFRDYHILINSYTSSLGGDINKIYNNLLNSKYLFLSTEKTAIQAAWTDYNYHDNTPMMFMGNGEYYKCVNTFIHEFGHYLNMYTCKSGGGDFDVCETQSQSNEALFQIYLRNNYKNISENGLKALNYKWLFNKMDDVISCALVYACEEALYGATNLTVDSVYKVCEDAIKAYGFNLANIPGMIDYGILCSAANPGYYISYATSGISSISMYKMALDDYSKATTTYLELLKIGDFNSYPKDITPLKITNALDAEDVETLFDINNFR